MQQKGVAVAAYTVAVLGLFLPSSNEYLRSLICYFSCDFSHQGVAHAFKCHRRYQTGDSYLVSSSSKRHP